MPDRHCRHALGATTFDGFPIACKGERGRALWLEVWTSFCGGPMGGLFLSSLRNAARQPLSPHSRKR